MPLLLSLLTLLWLKFGSSLPLAPLRTGFARWSDGLGGYGLALGPGVLSLLCLAFAAAVVLAGPVRRIVSGAWLMLLTVLALLEAVQTGQWTTLLPVLGAAALLWPLWR